MLNKSFSNFDKYFEIIYAYLIYKKYCRFVSSYVYYLKTNKSTVILANNLSGISIL